jgi:DNA-binding response OmpR family regulator
MDNVCAALSAGASGFLVKPFHLDRLAFVVRQFLERQ